MDTKFWNGKRVFITGHTGFKGSWLSIWLNALGAKVAGYALNPPTVPSLFDISKIGDNVKSTIGDVRDGSALSSAMLDADPDIVIHMAAQPLVKESYRLPQETYATNVMGTVHLFEAVRKCKNVRAVVIVTTDKCYENREWEWGYRECEPLGGHDPYSSSKACSELVTAAYRNSFYSVKTYSTHGVAVASARAGNVIGGGDWAQDRLIPDCVNALLNGKEIFIRSPLAIRPWQYVLEPLSGYLMLAQRLHEDGIEFSGAWNFGPYDSDARTVEWIVGRICSKWGADASYVIDKAEHPHEAQYLKLDFSKARTRLGWCPRWNLERALDKTVEWSRGYRKGADIHELCLGQIYQYTDTKSNS